MPSIVDLFAGEGGFIAGFDKAEDWNHLVAVEIDEKHCRVLREIFPELNVLPMDVAKVEWPCILNGKEVDCVVGGPPLSAL